MKKFFLKVILILIGLFLVWTLFNLISDAPEPVFDVGMKLDTSSVVNLLNDLYPPIPVNKNNGYYRLLTLTEPPGTDIESEEILNKYRKLHDPETTTLQTIKEWTNSDKNPKKGIFFKELRKKRSKILKKSKSWVDAPFWTNQDWAQLIWENRETVIELQDVFQLLLDRYQKVIECDHFMDFTLVVVEKNKINFNAHIPNLLAWLAAAKQYHASNILIAMQGEWTKGTNRILDHLDFAKKAVKGSRTLISNLVGKAVLKMSLFALASLMNQPNCPEEIFQNIHDRLTPIKYEEFGSRIPLLAESFSLSQVKSGFPLLQKNRTKKYFYDHLIKQLNCEKTPPHMWDSSATEPNKVKNGFFWWIQNPLGKIRFNKVATSMSIVNLSTVILKSHHTKTIYDMTRISAELHLKCNSQQSVQENLNALTTYRSLLDPCSGKPYKWHGKKQMLYSYGADRDDDGGKEGPITSWDADFFLPVILYVK